MVPLIVAVVNCLMGLAVVLMNWRQVPHVLLGSIFANAFGFEEARFQVAWVHAVAVVSSEVCSLMKRGSARSPTWPRHCRRQHPVFRHVQALSGVLSTHGDLFVHRFYYFLLSPCPISSVGEHPRVLLGALAVAGRGTLVRGCSIC